MRRQSKIGPDAPTVMDTTARRLATLRAALGFIQLPPRAPELKLLRRYLDTWAGIGLIAVGLLARGRTCN